MNWKRLFSACWFGHADPIKDFRWTKDGAIAPPLQLVHRCPACQADLGVILKGQKFKARKERKAKTLTFRKQKVG